VHHSQWEPHNGRSTLESLARLERLAGSHQCLACRAARPCNRGACPSDEGSVGETSAGRIGPHAPVLARFLRRRPSQSIAIGTAAAIVSCARLHQRTTYTATRSISANRRDWRRARRLRYAASHRSSDVACERRVDSCLIRPLFPSPPCETVGRFGANGQMADYSPPSLNTFVGVPGRRTGYLLST
jgi:hypothetical protein